jgi:protein tonB
MKKYFSIFVLSALSAYSVQAADTAQQLRKRDRVQLPVLKILPTQDGAAGAELVMLLDIDEKGRVKRRVWQEGKSGNPALRRQAVADAGQPQFTPPKSCEMAKDGQTVCKPVKSYAENVYLFYGPGENRAGEAYFLPVPRYPAISMEEGEEGTVRIAVHVSPEGKIVSVKVPSKRFLRLDRAAHKAALEGIYFPAIRDGKPVDTRLFISFNFILPQDKPSENAASAE